MGDENGFDCVAQLPDIVNEFLLEGGNFGEFKYEPNHLIEFFDKKEDLDRVFLHCAATLPLLDFWSELRFGLWVEIDQSTFLLFQEAQEDDELYSKFSCEGELANEWPLFPQTLGNRVLIDTVSSDHKPFIVDIDSINTEILSYISKESLDPYSKNKLKLRLDAFIIEHTATKKAQKLFSSVSTSVAQDIIKPDSPLMQTKPIINTTQAASSNMNKPVDTALKSKIGSDEESSNSNVIPNNKPFGIA